MREVDLTMPKLSMTMERGDLVSWERAEGDQISAGDVVCMIVSDKAEMEVEAPVDGRLARLVAAPGDSVPVGGALAVIETDAEEFISDLFGPSADETSKTLLPREELLATPSPSSARQIIPVIPAARRRANELGVVLASVTGTGPGGVVTVADIELFATQTERSSSEPRTVAHDSPRVEEAPFKASRSSLGLDQENGLPVELTPRQQSILRSTARAMSESATVPQFTLYRLFELDSLERNRGAIGWTPIFAAALSAALRHFPRLNGSWEESRGIVIHEQIRLGLAIDTDDGLVAPVLTDPDLTALSELSLQIKDLVARARYGRLNQNDTASPTFTLSNLGALGVDMFQALVTPPQAAVLSVGRARRHVVATDDGLAFRLGSWVGLTCDHRVVNGAEGARFLGHVAALLEADRTSTSISFGPPLARTRSGD